MNELYESVYQLYPRKVGKRAAIKAIGFAMTRLHDGENAGIRMTWEQATEFLRNRTRMYANSPAGQRGHLTPHPSTFYNQSRYLDDPNEWWELTPSEAEEQKMRTLNQVGVWRPQ